MKTTLRYGVAIVAVLAALTEFRSAAPQAIVDDDLILAEDSSDFELVDFRGKRWTVDEFADQPILVVAFLGTECPLAKIYSWSLQELASQYESRGVAFLAVDANLQDSLEQMGAFARQQSLQIPFAKDVGQRLMQHLGATRTPEVFVLDQQRRVRYRGCIDDQYGIGYSRKAPQREHLREALDALLKGRQPALAEVEPVGCLIGRIKEPDANAPVTFCNQVARILNAHCVRCHRQGQIGPFELTEYEEVAGWAEMIGEVVQEGRMPPWTADPQFGEFINDCSLPDADRETLLAWIEAGAPEGDPAEMPETPRFTEGWQLPREPDLIVDVSPEANEISATGDVRYQYFHVDPGFDTDRWVSAAELRPGNLAVVHHILCFVRPRGTQGLVDDEGLDGFLAGYVPGMLPQAMPAGYAKRIPANSELVFQVHYTPIGRVQFDQSQLGLIFADEATVTHEVITTCAVNPEIKLPPGESDHEEVAWNRRPLGAWQILNYMPHMHLRGKSFRYEMVRPDGQRDTLLNVPRFDFNWQIAYVLAEPLSIPAGTRIFCRATYDNSEANLANPNPQAEVRWGDQTWEEMMIGYFDIAVPRGEDVKTLWGAARPRRPSAEERAAQMFASWDKNGDHLLQRDETPERIRAAFDRIDSDGDGEITLEQLAQSMRRNE